MTVSRSDLKFFKNLDREAVAWRDKPPESKPREALTMDHKHINDAEAPEFKLTPAQLELKTECGKELAAIVSDHLLDLQGAGLQPDEAASVIVATLLEEAALAAIFSAFMDKREPNRDWHTQNAGKWYDRVKAVIDEKGITEVVKQVIDDGS